MTAIPTNTQRELFPISDSLMSPLPKCKFPEHKKHFDEVIIPLCDPDVHTPYYSINRSGNEVYHNSIKRMQTETQLYTEKLFESLLERSSVQKKQYKSTKVELTQTDPIDLAFDLYENGCNPLILNWTDPVHPGLSPENGEYNNEADLCQRTLLYASISTEKNPMLKEQLDVHGSIPSDGCIYSPSVPIMFTKRNGYFDRIPELFGFGFATLPRETHEDGWQTVNFRAPVTAALIHGHDALIVPGGEPLYEDDLKNYVHLFKAIYITP